MSEFSSNMKYAKSIGADISKPRLDTSAEGKGGVMVKIHPLQNENPPGECKGLYWRAYVSSYLSSYRSIEVKKSLKLLKRKSCSGCEQCEWLWEHIYEEIAGICTWDNPDYLSELKNGKVYTFQVNTSQGFEDLYPEIDSIEFIEVKEATDAT